jgi:phage-related minor tail protein
MEGSSLMPNTNSPAPYTLEGIVVEINAIKSTIHQLAETVGGLAQAVQSGRQTQWPVLTGFGILVMTVLGGLGVLSLSPIKDNLAKTDTRIEQLSGRIDMVAGTYVSRAENDRLRNEDKDRAAIVRQQINDDIKQLTESVNVIARTFVPRVEADAIARLQEKLADERAKNTALRLDRHSGILDRLMTK